MRRRSRPAGQRSRREDDRVDRARHRGQVGGDILLICGALGRLEQHEARLTIQVLLQRPQVSGARQVRPHRIAGPSTPRMACQAPAPEHQHPRSHRAPSMPASPRPALQPGPDYRSSFADGRAHSHVEMAFSSRVYPCTEWHTHSRLADLISDYRTAFPIVLIGNQIADSARPMSAPLLRVASRRSASSGSSAPPGDRVARGNAGGVSSDSVCQCWATARAAARATSGCLAGRWAAATRSWLG